MLFDCALGAIGVMCLDSIQYGFVKTVGLPVHVGITQGHGTLLREPSDQCRVHADKKGISRDAGDFVVKGDVRLLELFQIAYRLLVALQRHAQGLDLLGRRMLCRVARECHLEQATRRLEIAHAFVGGHGHPD